MLEHFVKNCSHGKDSHWRSLWRTVSCGRDPTLEQGKSVRSPPSEEEGAAETTKAFNMIAQWDRQIGRIWFGEGYDNVSRKFTGHLGSKGSDKHYKVQLQLVTTGIPPGMILVPTAFNV
ncbi:hypothetical protein QYF61_009817 [Mycteria americana]|uniref:Uncharacterized protein n=1 Tax=Mycteria americana TaxID=33587 RepID=A0AAN7S6U4_MYCAM|nr:hypothetical protein QYF61_009817 [Mycteria americana]